MRRQFIVTPVVLLAALRTPAALPAATPEEPKTFAQVIAARPAPELDDLVARSAPDRQDDAATESFWDILQLRDKPQPAAVTALAKVLADNAGSGRIHYHAAAQALFTAGTDEAYRALDQQVFKADYPIEQAVQFVSHWGMAEPARSAFFDRYLLKPVGEGLAVTARPVWQDRDGTHLLVITVNLTNTSQKPLALLLEPHTTMGRVHFRSPAGRYAVGGASGPICMLPGPRVVRLTPGASEQFELLFQLRIDPQALKAFRADPIKACLFAGGVDYGIEEFGKCQVLVALAQRPLTAEQFKDQRERMKQPIDPADLWTGRAVSMAAEFDIRETDAVAVPAPVPAADAAADAAEKAAAADAAAKAAAVPPR